MATSFLTRLRFSQRRSPDAMTLAEHIAELRQRVVISLFAYAVAFTVCFIVYRPILNWLREPYCQAQTMAHNHRGACPPFFVTAPLQGLSLRMKIAAYGGLILGAPAILWEIWRFITPGLYKNEKRYAAPFIVATIALFAAGAIVAYYSFPHALRFLMNVGGGPSILQPIYSPSSYLSLIMALMAIFGASFEFPMILVALQLAEVVTPSRLSSWRRWTIVIIVAGAAVFTPSGDPFSMFALAVPLYVFYEVSIVIGRVVLHRRISRARSAATEATT